MSEERIRETDEELVQWLCDIDHGLTEWETQFVESVASWVLDQKRKLSPKQRTLCERIAREKGANA